MLKRAAFVLGLGVSFALPGAAFAGDIIQGDTARLDVKAPQAVPAGTSRGTLKIGWFGTLSPKWLAPLTADQAISTTNSHKYFIHDALVKAAPEGLLTLSLADKVEASKDFTSYGFHIRDGVKFQDGEPVTAEDVKWTYENYAGVNEKMYHGLVASIDTPDARTVIFHLRQPSPDFLYLYGGGSTAGNIGWVVPKHYYEKVGEQGYLDKPVGAGPFSFVGQQAGTSLELEAFKDYWRRVPGVEKISVTSIKSPATGLAGLKTGEIDYFTNAAPVADQILKDPDIRFDKNFTGSWLLFFPHYEDAASPFHDRRVREAISLALNRPFLAVQGTKGLGMPWGNWVVPENPGYVEIAPAPFDAEKAKQLMADAGFANGIEIDGLIPFFVEPKTGERFLANLAAIGIRGPLQVLEGPQYFATIGRGRNGIESKSTIVMVADSISGPAAMMAQKYGLCDAPTSFICDPEIEKMWKDYSASLDPAERDRLSGEIQKRVIAEYYVVPTYRNTFLQAIGPRVLPAGAAEDGQGYHKLWDTPLTPFPYPWEDWAVQE